MGFYLGEGMTFTDAKKIKMEKITVEGADLAIEIGNKVKKDFDLKKLPLMLSMINAIVENKKLILNWEYFDWSFNEDEKLNEIKDFIINQGYAFIEVDKENILPVKK